MHKVCRLTATYAPLWTAALTLPLWMACPAPTQAEPPRREVAPGLCTTQVVPGVPYDLAGKRIVFTNGDWALPYSAHNVPHKYPRGQRKGAQGYAVWPKGRMVALEAETRGQFTLMPLLIPGRTLKINAVTKRTGGVRVECAGDPQRSFDRCRVLLGDLHWATVAWGDKADLGKKVGEPIILRFRLDKADLYGIEFD